MKIIRKKMNAEVPSVAMGDIAFNLLIFFVILAKGGDDSHVKWQAASTPKVESAGNSRCSVIVDVNHDLYFNGKKISINQLKSEVEGELGNAPAGKRVVLLKIDKGTTANLFEPIVEAVSEAGGELVHILQEKKS
jgi:biopolymer transport protein ExbD